MKDNVQPIFLNGAGEMRTLMRGYNWASSTLGLPSQWSQSLRAIVGILLNSKFPMFLFWGKDLICFYNDAYRPSLGNQGKHPSMLGMKAEEAWPEIWHIIKPLIDQVLAGGDAIWSEDQLIPIYRNGKLEDVYWTFSYSAAFGDNGNINGVFVTCYETTLEVNNKQKLRESNDELNFAIEATELATWDYNPITNKFTGNNRLKKWFGLPHDAQIDLSLAINVIAENDKERVTAAIQTALQYESGGLYNIEYTIRDTVTNEERSVCAKGRAWFGEDKKAYRFNGTLQDITKEIAARKQIAASEKRFSNILSQSLMAAAILQGPEMIVTFANEPIIDIWGKGKNVFGKPLVEVLPEIKDQVFPELLKNVYNTGVHFVNAEILCLLNRNGKLEECYFNLVYQPYRDVDDTITGITILATEVTAQVLAKKQMESSQNELKRYQHMADNATEPFILMREDGSFAYLNKLALQRWGYTEEEAQAISVPDVDPIYNEEVFKSVFETAQKQKIPQFETLHKKKDGSLYPVEINMGGLMLENKPHLFAIARDITERKKLEDTVRKSEEKIRGFILQAPVAMCLYRGPQHIIEIVNDELLKIWDKQLDAVIDKPIFEVLPEAEAQGFANLLQNVYLTGEKFTAFGIPMIFNRNGKQETVFVNLVYQAYREEDGVISGIVEVVSDVTEQVTATQQIKVSENQFRTFADSIQNLAWIADAGGWIHWYNKQWYDYTGSTLDEMQGWGWDKVHHPDYKEKVIAFVKDAWTKDEPFELTFPLRKHDGEYRWFLTRAYPVKDAGGNIERWIGTNTDITEQKSFAEELERKVNERTEELQAANQALENSNAELKSFSFIASHDLQEPLRKIQTFSSRILDTGELSEKTQDYFNRIIAASDRMKNLIVALLDFSRANTMDLNFVTCDLNAIVEEAKTDLQITINEKQAVVECGQLPVINGLHIQLLQLFTNLIENGIKYSRQNVVPHIKISAQRISGASIGVLAAKPQWEYHVIKIADNGIGFEKEYSTKIFELFQRLHGRNEYTGTGIGLAIVKKIVLNHKGFIIAEGTPDVGAIFTIYIPAYEKNLFD